VETVGVTADYADVVFQNSLDAIILMDVDGVISGWNPRAEALFGWKSSEVVGRTVVSTIIPERFRQAHLTGLKRYLKTGESRVDGKILDLYATHRRGHEFPIELAIARATVDGRTVFIGTARDNTEQRYAEALRSMQFKLTRALAESHGVDSAAPKLIKIICDALGWDAGDFWIVDRDKASLRWSASWGAPGGGLRPFLKANQALTFKKGQPYIGRMWRTLKPVLIDIPVDRSSAVRSDPAVAAGIRTLLGFPLVRAGHFVGAMGFYTRRHQRTDRSLLDVMADVGTQIGEFLNWSATEEATRIDLDNQLQAAARQSSVLLEATGEGMYGVDTEGRCTFVNRAALEVLGYRAVELVGHDVHQLLHHSRADGSAYPLAECPIKQVINFGRSTRHDREVLWTRRGRPIAVDYSASPILIDGDVRGVVVCFRDIRKRLETEEALRVSESSFRHLFTGSPVPMWIWDQETFRFVEVNRAAVSTYGYSSREFARMTMADICRPEDLPELMERMNDGEHLRMSGPWRQLKKDGSVIEVELTSHQVQFGGRLARFVMAEDITGERQLQRQLEHVQRLDSLGQLAGGIAHDFNNVLAVILSYAALLKEQVEGATDSEMLDLRQVSGDVMQIGAAAERGSQLTGQLLAFARRDVVKPELLEVNDVVLGAEEFLLRTLGEQVQFFSRLSPNLWRVRMDAGKLQQVLVNLAINARDAMPKGGELVVDTENVEVDALGVASHPGAMPGNYVRLCVSDNGGGMDVDILEHAFEPFFTTKPKGKGTGLGLSTVYGIVTQAGGFVEIRSDPDRGTTVAAFIPATEEGMEIVPGLREDEPRSGVETVLLLEDEESLLEATRRILALNGYKVLVANRGTKAIELAQNSAFGIDLLISDVVMPEMPGTVVAERIRELHPGVSILFVSGYAQPTLESVNIPANELHVLAKPFTTATLLSKVREILDAG
jgi:PAS domain S-box-containing protein